MQKRVQTTESSAEGAPATLGDVLYAKTKAPVAEQNWAMLVQAIAGGDRFALHALYEMSHRIVFTLIMRITANAETAERLAVEVFHDVWRYASRYDPANGTVLAWLMNHAHSRAVEWQRSQEGGPAAAAVVPSDPLKLRAEAGALRAAVAALAPEERRAIEATYFAGLTHAEAATRLNQPLDAITTHIRSGLHKLRHALSAGAKEP